MDLTAGIVKYGNKCVSVIQISILKENDKLISSNTEDGTMLKYGTDNLGCLDDKLVTDVVAVTVVSVLQHIYIANKNAELTAIAKTHSALYVNDGLVVGSRIFHACKCVTIRQIVDVGHIIVDLIGGPLQRIVQRTDLGINVILHNKLVPTVGKMLGCLGKMLQGLNDFYSNSVGDKNKDKNDKECNKHHNDKQTVGILLNIVVINVNDKTHSVNEITAYLGMSVIGIELVHGMLVRRGKHNVLTVGKISKAIVVNGNFRNHVGDECEININTNDS